ncbi:unnamed protein product, partial [Mesorhabditis belari]|uniref:SAM domain-containing protein n=1 Tax=Mesorhabditis belari TaxID=2138241 RepID=A0AAF3EX69_9BILA
MWQAFFMEAGIPANIASRYAKAFEENRITKAMIGDLDKSTLAELGVKAVGDQIAILRRIKDGPSIQTTVKTLKVRVPITGPPQNHATSISSSSSSTEVMTASEARRGRPPPDRQEIYHIRMPTGATRKTQQILQRAAEMRNAGLLKRAHSGVRQGGRPVNPVSKDPSARRLALHNRFMEQEEVSSSTDNFSERLGTRGMYSDRVHGGRVMKREKPGEEKLLTRALHSAVTSMQSIEAGPRIQVRLPSNTPTYSKMKATISAPRSVMRMGIGASMIAKQRKQTGVSGVTIAKKASLVDRVKFKGNTTVKRSRPNVKIMYEEDDSEMTEGLGDQNEYGCQDVDEWQEENDEQSMDNEDEIDYDKLVDAQSLIEFECDPQPMLTNVIDDQWFCYNHAT